MVCVQEDCDIVWDDYHLNNGHQFTNNIVEELVKKLVTKHHIMTSFKPNNNELVVCMRKVMCNIKSKEVEVGENLHNCEKVHHVLSCTIPCFSCPQGLPLFNLHMK